LVEPPLELPLAEPDDELPAALPEAEALPDGPDELSLPPEGLQSLPVLESLPLMQFSLLADFVPDDVLAEGLLIEDDEEEGDVEEDEGVEDVEDEGEDDDEEDGVVAVEEVVVSDDFDLLRSPIARAFALASANTEMKNTGASLRI
jgi:hypothetical protein